MKQTVLFTALGLAAFGAAAQEYGNVLSSTPVIQQVAVPRTVCQPVAPAQVSTTGGGAAVGGLTGAGIGSMIGHGSGNTAAIAVGAIMGAIVGNNVEAQNQRYAQTVPQCFTENVSENRTVGYDVVYEYRGQQYSARMPYDPGRSVQLQMQQTLAQAAPATPLGNGGGVVVAPPVQSAQVAPAPQQQYQQPQPQYQQQPQYTTVPTPVATVQTPVVVQGAAPVVYGAPYPAYPAAYPAYPYPAYPYPYYRPYYAPVGVSLGFVFGSGGHGHGHGHGHR